MPAVVASVVAVAAVTIGVGQEGVKVIVLVISTEVPQGFVAFTFIIDDPPVAGKVIVVLEVVALNLVPS